MRSIEFGGVSYRREKAAMADLYLTPDVRGFGPQDFLHADAMMEAGYQESCERLRGWLASAPDLERL